jgi:hypothetical protein
MTISKSTILPSAAITGVRLVAPGINVTTLQISCLL